MIKYLIMDVDGTLTDGKIYMGSSGEVMKAFSVKDGYVINFILKPNNIVPVVITARTSTIVQNRCDELGIKEVYQEKLDKLKALKEIVGENNIGNCAYFGDDILDLKCMLLIKDAGGIVGCPSDAVQEIKAISDYICINKAGEGALREFSEWIIKPKINNLEIDKRVKEAVSYIKSIVIKEADIGKKIIVNDKFYYYVQSYMTKIENECKLESHRKYVDIQVMLNGEEVMDFADISRLQIKEEYNPKDDVVFWKIPKRMARTTLKAGDCIILYPENAHRGAIAIDNKGQYVLKVVGKVNILD